MTDNTMQFDSADATPVRSNAFLRGFIEGAASLFDIFRAGAYPQRLGTPEDDARELYGDVEEIAQDFRVVLSGIESASKK